LKLIVNIEISKYSYCLYLAHKMKRRLLRVNTVVKLPFSVKGLEFLDYQCLDKSAIRVWSLELRPELCFLSHQSITLQNILLLQCTLCRIHLDVGKRFSHVHHTTVSTIKENFPSLSPCE
jgi:hypothetical protein